MSEYRDRDRGDPRPRDDRPRDDRPRDPPRDPRGDPPREAPVRAQAASIQGLVPVPPAPIVFRPLDVHATELERPYVCDGGAPKVIAAIVGVMSRVREVPKLGRNKADNYDFVRWADLSALLQDALVQEKLVVAPREIKSWIVPGRSKGSVLFTTFQFDCWHAEGQYILNMATGTGACRFEFQSGTLDDKAENKTITSAQKAMLTALFKIPSDVDQDIERDVFADPETGQLTGEDARRRLGPGDPGPRGDERPRNGNGGGNGNGERPRDNGRPREDDSRPPPPANHGPPDDRGPPAGFDDRRRVDEAPRDRGPSDDRGPPAGFDDAPPFDGPPAGYGPPPDTRDDSGGTRAASPAERDLARDFQRNVQAFNVSLRDVTTREGADQIWVENRTLLEQMADTTYEHFRQIYVDRWRDNPPR